MDKKFLHCSSCEDKKWHDKILGLNYQCRGCDLITHLSKLKNNEAKLKKNLKESKGKEIVKVKKEKREIDDNYLKFIRSLPCLVNNEECFGVIEAHHQERKSQLGSDYSAIPLCHKHHIGGVHLMGVDSFARRYSIDYDAQIKRLNILYKLKFPKKETNNT